MTQHQILVIDSDPEALFETGRVLEKNKYNVTMAQSGNSGIEFLASGNFALVLAEFPLEETTGQSVLQAIRDASPETMIVLQGKTVDSGFIKTIFKENMNDCIFKPYQPEELLFRVRKNIETYELKQKMRLRKSFFSSCCVCKKIRSDDYGSHNDRWMGVEDFLKEEMDILLSSTYCPKCAQTVQEDLLGQIDRLNALKVSR